MQPDFEQLFSRHRSARIPALWPWQDEVITAFGASTGDVAIELPTGTGKTLVGLLAGERYRESSGRPVAYLAGNKQLALQIERQARDLGFSVVRFQGPKDDWEQRDVRSFNFGQAIGIMNYWNYFNANPGVEPAGFLILDDVHLIEGPLRDLFTVQVAARDPVCARILNLIAARCPYYSIASDLLNGVDVNRPPEMLTFPDSSDLAGEVRDELDGSLADGTPSWWAWKRIRSRLEVCCWLVSQRGITFTPYIPPTQTVAHFSRPEQRLYLSATIGTVDDLQRRLGTPPLTKVTAAVQPRQGDRLVVMRPGTELVDPIQLVDELRDFLVLHRKALWLCARRDTASGLEAVLVLSGLGPVRRLEADNGADEQFANDPTAHLVSAGRYDGMDFPGDTCRVEVVPEVPVATSDLEEFVSAYLRDAPFADARLGQRVAQALGRCNRTEDDLAVYLLTDPEFIGRFSQRRMLDAVPGDVRDDIYAALEFSDRPFGAVLADATRFLAGEPIDRPQAPPVAAQTSRPAGTGGLEVGAMLALWREDYGKASSLSDEVALALTGSVEHRAFWLSMRALALRMAATFGDRTAVPGAQTALRAAATAGASSTFFTRLRLSEARLAGQTVSNDPEDADIIFAAWDRLIDRLGPDGPQFGRWAQKLLSDLASDSHNLVASTVARVGLELLGVPSRARRPTSGEEDAFWELSNPRRILAFEVKLAPESQKVTSNDVDQAEGAVKALETVRSLPARGLLVTPHQQIDASAHARFDRVRPMRVDTLIAQVRTVMDLLSEYRRGWSIEPGARMERRSSVEHRLPPTDWLWLAASKAKLWLDPATIQKIWPTGP